MIRLQRRTCLTAALLATLTAASIADEAADAFSAGNSPQAHVHGRAQLLVAVDGSEVVVRFESPAEAVFGFERAPRQADEWRATAAAIKHLTAADAMNVSAGGERCQASTATWSTPLFNDAALARGVQSPQAMARNDNSSHDDHGTADKRDDNAHNGLGDDAGSDHADVTVTWSFRCEAEADQLEHMLFGTFPRLLTLDVVIAGNHGQTARTATRSQPPRYALRAP